MFNIFNKKINSLENYKINFINLLLSFIDSLIFNVKKKTITTLISQNWGKYNIKRARFTLCKDRNNHQKYAVQPTIKQLNLSCQFGNEFEFD